MSDGGRQMRTGAWYGDDVLQLRLPLEWRVKTHWPAAPRRLSPQEIAAAFEQSVGQPPIRELCRGKKRPLIIVDDLTRPTPAADVLPSILQQMRDAGLRENSVTILVATGTHGAPARDALISKVGAEIAAHCRFIVHDCRSTTVRVGTTRAGTPVYVNPEVLRSDFVVGIGGVYPNYTAGFGGGAKLALGVLGRRSILHLHYAHRSMGGVYDAENSFRRDLTEIAEMISLNTTVSVHVNEAREIVRLQCGDHRRYYAEAVEFSRSTYDAPGPGDADVVISNTYPEDLSLVFARMKGFVPLRQAKASASLVAIARCSEGVGTHGLFPELERTRKTAARDLVRRLSVMSLGDIVTKIASKMRLGGNQTESAHSETCNVARNPILLYVTGELPGHVPSVPGIRITNSWDEVLRTIDEEQNGRKDLSAILYPCAPLQCVSSSSRSRAREGEPEAVTAT